MCLARSTPHTGSSRAQGLWSEYTAKPQLAAPKGSTGPVFLAYGALAFARARPRRLITRPRSNPVSHCIPPDHEART